MSHLGARSAKDGWVLPGAAAMGVSAGMIFVTFQMVAAVFVGARFLAPLGMAGAAVLGWVPLDRSFPWRKRRRVAKRKKSAGPAGDGRSDYGLAEEIQRSSPVSGKGPEFCAPRWVSQEDVQAMIADQGSFVALLLREKR